MMKAIGVDKWQIEEIETHKVYSYEHQLLYERLVLDVLKPDLNEKMPYITNIEERINSREYMNKYRRTHVYMSCLYCDFNAPDKWKFVKHCETSKHKNNATLQILNIDNQLFQ